MRSPLIVMMNDEWVVKKNIRPGRERSIARAVRYPFRKLVDILSALRFRALQAVYYRFLFGRTGWLAAKLYEVVSVAERERYSGDIPTSKDAWNSQYLSGYWGYMARVEEAARYSVIVGYLASLKPGGSVLDVGCGEGILQMRLRRRDYSRYVGIDVSEAAIARASQRADTRTVFVTADAAAYTPPDTFDAIVFNEILYYLSDPTAVFERYTCFLNPGGILVTSLYRLSPRANAIRRQLRARYATVSETRAATGHRSWTCTVFQVRHSQDRSAS